MSAQPQQMSPQDEGVYYKAKVELKVNPKTSDFAKDLKLQVRKGVITVEGKVPTEQDKKNTEQVLFGVMDVAGVVNKLTTA